MNGTVTDFDQQKGYGTVTASDGASYFFHCTQLTDGTRTVERGAPVAFRLRPWHRGQVEATDLAPQ